MGTVLLILLVLVIVVLVVYAIVTYNGLVRRRNETEEAYRQIDVQLKRRYDLIPNFLEGVKKYFRQEQEVLGEITRARSQAMQPQSPKEQAQSEARRCVSFHVSVCELLCRARGRVQTYYKYLELYLLYAWPLDVVQ